MRPFVYPFCILFYIFLSRARDEDEADDVSGWDVCSSNERDDKRKRLATSDDYDAIYTQQKQQHAGHMLMVLFVLHGSIIIHPPHRHVRDQHESD